MYRYEIGFQLDKKQRRGFLKQNIFRGLGIFFQGQINERFKHCQKFQPMLGCDTSSCEF